MPVIPRPVQRYAVCQTCPVGIAQALRIYFRLLKDYVESFVPEPLYVLTESELVYRWVTTCGEVPL